MISIRPILRRDLPACAELAEAVWPNENIGPRTIREISEHFNQEYYSPPLYFVAIVDETIVGHAGYQKSWMSGGDVYELSWVMVHPSRQKRGIGRALIAHIRNEIRHKDQTAQVMVFVTGVPEFYAKLGCEIGRQFNSRWTEAPCWFVMDWL